MPNMSDEELKQEEAALSAEIRRLLPDFVRSCHRKDEVVIIHQDSFAADYQQDEYALLGMAIKFAGLHGKEVHIACLRFVNASLSRTIHIMWKLVDKVARENEEGRTVYAQARGITE